MNTLQTKKETATTFFNPNLRICFSLILERVEGRVSVREREWEKERDKDIDVREIFIGCLYVP